MNAASLGGPRPSIPTRAAALGMVGAIEPKLAPPRFAGTSAAKTTEVYEQLSKLAGYVCTRMRRSPKRTPPRGEQAPALSPGPSATIKIKACPRGSGGAMRRRTRVSAGRCRDCGASPRLLRRSPEPDQIRWTSLCSE